MKTINDVLETFREIERIRQKLADDIAEINRNELISDSLKSAQIREAKDRAQKSLAIIAQSADDAISALSELTANKRTFDYGDERLLSAVEFVKLNGSALPEKAWRQMVKDFDGRPQELMYLSSLFEKSGVVSGAIEAKEAAQKANISATLPQRVADKIWYVCTADATAHIDTSGIINELNSLQEVPAEE